MYSPERNVVGICSALFVLAIAYLALGEWREAAALLEAFRSQPLLSKAAWAIVVLVPIVLVPVALWLGATLVRQRYAAQVLELRLGGVREGVKVLEKPQADAEAAVHHLVRTDPEDAVVTMQQRLTEAERFAQIQQAAMKPATSPPASSNFAPSSRHCRSGSPRSSRKGGRSSSSSWNSVPGRAISNGRLPRSPARTMPS